MPARGSPAVFRKEAGRVIGKDPARGRWPADQVHVGPVAGLVGVALQAIGLHAPR